MKPTCNDMFATFYTKLVMPECICFQLYFCLLANFVLLISNHQNTIATQTDICLNKDPKLTKHEWISITIVHLKYLKFNDAQNCQLFRISCIASPKVQKDILLSYKILNFVQKDISSYKI